MSRRSTSNSVRTLNGHANNIVWNAVSLLVTAVLISVRQIIMHRYPFHRVEIVKNKCNQLTVNGERYRNMLMDCFWRQLANIDVNNVSFRQDGATSHRAWGYRIVARKVSQKRLFHGMVWTGLPGSWDVLKSSCEGFVKSHLNETIPDLQQNIKNLPRDMWETVARRCAKHSRIDVIF